MVSAVVDEGEITISPDSYIYKGNHIHSQKTIQQHHPFDEGEMDEQVR